MDCLHTITQVTIDKRNGKINIWCALCAQRLIEASNGVFVTAKGYYGYEFDLKRKKEKNNER